MPFRFRFKVLLQHRQYLVRKAQINLAAVQIKHDAVAAQKSALEQQIAEHIRLWEEKQKSGMPIAEYLSFDDYLRTLERHLLDVDNELKRAAVEVEKAKQALIEREKDSKILDSLQETEKEAYRYLQGQKEQKGMDEVATFQEFHHNEEG